MLAEVFADIDTGEIPFMLSGYTEEEYGNLVTACPKLCMMTSRKRRTATPSPRRRQRNHSPNPATSGYWETTALLR